MSAFEELGVAPELIKAVEDLGWELPTPVQAEAVPLILGGGDVMASAETGSGKTGAFSLPLLQIVHEALASQRRSVAAAAAVPAPGGEPAAAPCQLNPEDRGDIVAIAPDGVTCQARSDAAWGGVRASVGALAGRWYYEASVRDEGLCRVGWATHRSTLDIGTDNASFGFGGTGMKSHARKFEPYGEAFGLHDTVGCLLDLDAGKVTFTKNGQDLGAAFTLGKQLQGQPLFPAVTLKNAELVMNFGGAPFKHPPPAGFSGLAQATGAYGTVTRRDLDLAAAAAAFKGGPRRPLALILEPSRELAEQTHTSVALFAKHLTEPSVASALVVTGMSAGQQAKAIREGVDVVVGTPGRVIEFVESGKLPMDAIKFFVLDEADGLLDAGSQADILKLFRLCPQAGAGTSRLQVLLFSATLHSPKVRSLAAKICQNPILVDLQGKDAVPESVDHVLVKVDPREDRTWLQSEPAVPVDGVHALEPPTGPDTDTPEGWSQAVKRLKPRLLARLADALQMGQALVFCRTNQDCDNLEAFFNALDGGGGGGGGASRKRERGPHGAYSCMVLAGKKSMEERRLALQAFKDGDVRFLIATDVAARGLDIQGLPFVVNMTLPERGEDYIHRIGRVGRADCVGLAVSLVAAVPEKVWYCTAKGPKPWLKPDASNTRTADKGGQTVWIQEPALLAEVEKSLAQPVAALGPELQLPPEVAARVAGGSAAGQYGHARRGEPAYVEEARRRIEATRPVLQELVALERKAQATFFAMQGLWKAPGAGHGEAAAGGSDRAATEMK